MVEAKSAKVWQPPAWLLVLAFPALLLEHGSLLAAAVVGGWLFLRLRSNRSLAELRSALNLQTKVEHSIHREAARAFQVDVVEAANRGDGRALEQLLERWRSCLPVAAQAFSVRLSRTAGKGCQITGIAIGPEDIPTSVSRDGRGGRTVLDKRKVNDVDDDLTEFNAAAALSLLLALFGDADRAFVHLSVQMTGTPAGDLPWVRLAGYVGYTELQAVISRMEEPSEAVRELGGTVGRRRARQFHAAEDPLITAPSTSMPEPPNNPVTPKQNVASSPQPQDVPASPAPDEAEPAASASIIATGPAEANIAAGLEVKRTGWTKATPQRKDGIGPDPAALIQGQINPQREGKVLDAIRAGTAGSTVQSLMAATGLREPTVKYFGISASEAGLVDAIRIGGTYHFVVQEDDDKASQQARAVRAEVLALSESEGLKQWRRLGRASFSPVGALTAPAAIVSKVEKVPTPPPGRPQVPGEPTPRGMRGPFGVVAKRWADYEGNSEARYVPFHHYYPTYENLDAEQLRCYFGWRKAFRGGMTPPADLSYLFLHIYELIHVVGVPDLRRAGTELERVWTSYRPTYRKLDNHLVPWIADLYATEGLTDEVAGWYRRAVAAGAAIPDREAVTDLYWAASDYPGMPRLALATLSGDPKLGANKFCLEHNVDGWVERGYREAISAADEAFKATHGKPLRSATIEADGLHPLTREAFAGAVYDWKRVRVTIAQLPNLGETSLAVRTFQSAVRYAENLLREQRKYKARLRGVEIDGQLASAIDRRLARFIEATRPRTRVTIDLVKAKELEQESSEVRDILLGGLNVAGATRDGSGHATSPVLPEDTPAGLLTDLAAIQASLAACTVQARAVLETFLAADWELASTDQRLSAAAGGALVGPLIDEINGCSVTAVGDLIIVPEGDLFVVQEDFRDEVYCVLRGSLEGYGKAKSDTALDCQVPAATPEPETDSYGFGPAELEALRLLFSGNEVDRKLEELGAAHASSALLLIDRVNELALASPHGDVVVDGSQDPPALIEDGRDWVASLIARFSESAPSPSLTAR